VRIVIIGTGVSGSAQLLLAGPSARRGSPAFGAPA
jgi:hypothetical protein